jgi:four helix bundle protein
MAIIRSFRALHVYQLAKMEAKRIFLLTKNFPAEEKYSLTDQIRRSSRAVNAMIAESWARRQESRRLRIKL